MNWKLRRETITSSHSEERWLVEQKRAAVSQLTVYPQMGLCNLTVAGHISQGGSSPSLNSGHTFTREACTMLFSAAQDTSQTSNRKYNLRPPVRSFCYTNLSGTRVVAVFAKSFSHNGLLLLLSKCYSINHS